RGRRCGEQVASRPALTSHLPQGADAVSMVGVLVGIKHRVEPFDVGVEQLLAQIRRRIDEHAGSPGRVAALDQQRAASAAVLGIGGIGVAPAEPAPRHSSRRAAAEDGGGERHAAFMAARGALVNRRKKLSVVCCAMSSTLSPRVCASTRAVSVTYDGSLRLPRHGPGARYGASVSTKMRSGGSSAAIARRSSDRLNVRMPENET